ncbi:Mor transcription activator family protein [Photobacterium nomapromontoriensis]|uniref:Mor transcription activator family protein n=1 Tax=Photobacterium nomapromontoriensis TaxID=2910237 RepID=UPI003D0DB369
MTLVKLYDSILKAIVSVDLGTDTHQQVLAKTAVLALSFYCGGRAIYLPKGRRIKCALRNNEIFSQIGKYPSCVLAAKYNLSDRQINHISEQMHAARRRNLRITPHMEYH